MKFIHLKTVFLLITVLGLMSALRRGRNMVVTIDSALMHDRHGNLI